MDSAKYKAICELKELCRRNMLGITPEDSNFIVERMPEIFHDVYFIIDEWQRIEATIRVLRSTLAANSEWESVLAKIVDTDNNSNIKKGE